MSEPAVYTARELDRRKAEWAETRCPFSYYGVGTPCACRLGEEYFFGIEDGYGGGSSYTKVSQEFYKAFVKEFGDAKAVDW